MRRYSKGASSSGAESGSDRWSLLTSWYYTTFLSSIALILALAVALLVTQLLFVLFLFWPSTGNLRWVGVALPLLGIVGAAGNQIFASGGGARPVVARWGPGLAVSIVCTVAAVAYGQWIEFDPFRGGEAPYSVAVPLALMLLLSALTLLPVAIALVGALSGGGDSPRRFNLTSGGVQAIVVLPLMMTAYLMASTLLGPSSGPDSFGVSDLSGSATQFFVQGWRYLPFSVIVLFTSLGLLSLSSIRSLTLRATLAVMFAPLMGVPILYVGVCTMVLLFSWGNAETGLGAPGAFVWGAPFIAVFFAASVIFMLGLLRRHVSVGTREWWYRLSAWLGIYSVGWSVIALVALYGAISTDILHSPGEFSSFRRRGAANERRP